MPIVSQENVHAKPQQLPPNLAEIVAVWPEPTLRYPVGDCGDCRGLEWREEGVTLTVRLCFLRAWTQGLVKWDDRWLVKTSEAYFVYSGK